MERGKVRHLHHSSTELCDSVLHCLQQCFSHNTMVTVCCMRRDMAWVLNAANSYSPYRRHEYSTQSHYTDTRSTRPSFILLMPSPNLRPPDYEATFYPIGHPAGRPRRPLSVIQNSCCKSRVTLIDQLLGMEF